MNRVDKVTNHTPKQISILCKKRFMFSKGGEHNAKN